MADISVRANEGGSGVVVAGLVLAGIAGLIHVYIFYLESVVWTSARARAVFGTSRQEAEITRQLAFNQGFYNLFLAVAVVVGIVAYAVGAHPVGATLVFVGAGSMVAAGLVLLISAPSKASAALKQLLPPLLAVVALAVGLNLG
ncbi:DUF1304 domain-containing protein [Micromonospora sp. HUAS LYJ1]|uniref:DUF1304 domain-containing protein n=1 Tax=Micromonospora sp. HUAS LYJ1 TaxID=3061626 RepID=UPI002673012D|nr:DUF1304 domain-containing protein [Micromonospora sp. HUAS LYJ1]WKU03920.1 DUF1304 domain-containing protein [Micromonospora sp. HUAS LYJ1]